MAEQKAPSLILPRSNYCNWQVGIDDKNILLVLEYRNKQDVIVFNADTARNLGAALHRAAQELTRRLTLKAGEIVGKI